MTTAQLLAVDGFGYATARTSAPRQRTERCTLTNEQLYANMKIADSIGNQYAADEIAIELIARGYTPPQGWYA